MVRLVAYNIEHSDEINPSVQAYLKAAHSLQTPTRIDKEIASYLARVNPDILGLVEVDTGSIRSRHKDEAAFFANALGFDTVVKTSKYGSDDYWHALLSSLPIFKHQDNALLSKYDVEQARFHSLSKGVKNIAIEVKFAEPEPHTVILVHFALFKRARRQQLDDLRRIIQGIDGPAVLCGDFNTFDTDEFNHLLETTRLHDAYQEVDHPVKTNTAPTWNPTYRLDNVLHTPGIELEDYTVLDATCSDHRPVLMDYSVSTK